MTLKEMVELVQQHHPHIGEVELVRLINRAKYDFCLKTEMIKDSYTSSTVANQRYYTLPDSLLKITSVWLKDTQIPQLIGKHVIDDDTEETG